MKAPQCFLDSSFFHKDPVAAFWILDYFQCHQCMIDHVKKLIEGLSGEKLWRDRYRFGGLDWLDVILAGKRTDNGPTWCDGFLAEDRKRCPRCRALNYAVAEKCVLCRYGLWPKSFTGFAGPRQWRCSGCRVLNNTGAGRCPCCHAAEP